MNETVEPVMFLGQGDTLPPVRAILRDATGAPVDLSSATEVVFRLRHALHQTITATGAATIDVGAGADGEDVVEYSWVAGDTDQAGDHEPDWIITFASGDQLTVPNDVSDIIRIKDTGTPL